MVVASNFQAALRLSVFATTVSFVSFVCTPGRMEPRTGGRGLRLTDLHAEVLRPILA